MEKPYSTLILISFAGISDRCFFPNRFTPIAIELVGERREENCIPGNPIRPVISVLPNPVLK